MPPLCNLQSISMHDPALRGAQKNQLSAHPQSRPSQAVLLCLNVLHTYAHHAQTQKLHSKKRVHLSVHLHTKQTIQNCTVCMAPPVGNKGRHAGVGCYAIKHKFIDVTYIPRTYVQVISIPSGTKCETKDLGRSCLKV